MKPDKHALRENDVLEGSYRKGPSTSHSAPHSNVVLEKIAWPLSKILNRVSSLQPATDKTDIKRSVLDGKKIESVFLAYII